MGIFGIVGILVVVITYTAILFYLIVLAGRLVRAVESIAKKFESSSKT